MQAVKETIRCARCGCLALPDANKCPKCGANYRNSNGDDAKQMLGPFTYLSTARMDNIGNSVSLDTSIIKVIRAYYQLTCPRHGKIHVRAMVIGTPVKCPFCE